MDDSDQTGEIASFLSPSQRRALAARDLRSQRDPTGSGPIREQHFAAVLYVDVSGFTALTERLGRQGARGAEALSHVIDACFGRMTEIVSAAGGEVVSFAGDALLAAWPVDSESALDDATFLAAQAALAVQRQMDGYEAAGEVLRLRASVGAGTLELLELGGDDGRPQFLTRGDSIVQAVVADRGARPSDVVLSALAWRRVADRCRAVVLDSGDARLAEVTRPLVDIPSPPPAFAVPEDVLRRFVPRVVLERLAAGHAEWMAEFRDATLVFVKLCGTESEDMRDDTRLDRAVRTTETTLARWEGSLHGIGLDDKGTTLVAAFGLPPLAHEDDPGRAVRAARDISDALAALGSRPSIGIATGRIWCGVSGGEQRRQYTVFGTAVNLAARLMQAADAEILCDARTAGTARADGANFDEAPAIPLKGLPHPQPVFRPRRPESEPAHREARPRRGDPAQREDEAETRMVGRREEIEAFRAALAHVRNGAPCAVLLVEGEAGMGKSLLVQEWTRHARRAGARLLIGHGDPVESATAYYPWRSVLRNVFGLASTPGNRESERAGVLRRLDAPGSARAPGGGRAALAALLNAVLPLGFPESARTRVLAANVRAERTRSLLLQLLRESAGAEPTVLLLEDAHWFDSASWDLALLVARELSGTVLILTGRSVTPAPEGLAQILEQTQTQTQRIALRALTPDQTLAVACACLGVGDLPEPVAALIRDKAGGHPLHAKQLALALRDGGAIRVEGGRCRLTADVRMEASALIELLGGVSGTLQGAIMNRIDRLPPGEQLALKVASVLGNSFAAPALSEIHPQRPDAAALACDLASIAARGLIRIDSEEPDATHAFDHALTRDVVYESIPFAQRRRFHEAAAAWYESTGGDRPHLYPLLAHHWKRAEVYPKASEYLGRAGRHALDEHASEEAVRFLKEALELDSGGASAPAGTRGLWSLQIGRAYVNWSRHSQGRTHLERGIEAVDRRLPANTPLALLAGLREAARQGVHRLRPSRFVGRGRGEAEQLLQIARGYEGLVEVYFLDNSRLHCLYCALRALNVAERAGRSPELARGYASMGAILGFMKVHRAADAYARRALAMADDVADPGARAWACLSAGVYKAGLGAWDQSARLFEEASALSESLEDHRRWDDSRMNLSTLSWLRGDFTQALALAERCHESASRRRDARCRAASLLNRAACFVVTGDRKQLAACTLEMDGLADATLALRPADVMGLSAIRAWCEARLGDFEAAAVHAEHALRGLSSFGAFYPLLIEYAALAEVYLTLWERSRSDGSPGGAVSFQRRGAKKVCALLRAYARAFPIGKPADLWFRGRMAWLENRPGRAKALWRASIAAAEYLGMPYWAALGHRELGLHGDDSLRARHADQARETLARLGAPHSEADGRQGR